MLTVADRGEGGDKICQNLADVICERSLTLESFPLNSSACPQNGQAVNAGSNKPFFIELC